MKLIIWKMWMGGLPQWETMRKSSDVAWHLYARYGT